MSTYIVVESNVLDIDKLKQYSELAAPTVAKFGGEFLSKGKTVVLHGSNSYTNKAIIQFKDQQAARDWYYSDDYQALIELRNQAMDSQFHLVSSN